jgi:hypothetical protein
MKSFLHTILVLVLLISCHGNYENIHDIPVNNIPVPIEKIANYSFQDVFEVEAVLPIKGSENLPITEIQKILKIENKLWILTSNLILITDAEGNLEKTIQSLGEGPLEFLKLSDIQWNPFFSLVEVLDTEQGKIIRYDLNGSPISEWKNKYLRLSTAFQPSLTSYWIYGGTFFDGDGDRLIVVDIHEGKKLKGFFPLGFERNYLGVLEANNFISKNNETVFYHSYNDTLYEIQNDKPIPSFFLNFGSHRVPQEIIKKGTYKNNMEFGLELEKNKLVDFLNSVFYTNNRLFFRFFYEGKPITAIYNLDEGTTNLINDWEDHFGINYSKLTSYLINFPIGSDEEFLYFSIDPYAVKAEIEKLKNDPKLNQFLSENPYLASINNQFGSYENPYILKVKVRN